MFFSVTRCREVFLKAPPSCLCVLPGTLTRRVGDEESLARLLEEIMSVLESVFGVCVGEISSRNEYFRVDSVNLFWPGTPSADLSSKIWKFSKLLSQYVSSNQVHQPHHTITNLPSTFSRINIICITTLSSREHKIVVYNCTRTIQRYVLLENDCSYRHSSQESTAVNSWQTIHGTVVRSNCWWYGGAVTNKKEVAFREFNPHSKGAATFNFKHRMARQKINANDKKRVSFI